MSDRFYYYLHVNGDLIHKPEMPGILQDFADSDLVRDYWLVDVTERGTGYVMLISAAKAGAKMGRVLDLAATWGMDGDDALKFCEVAEINVTTEKLNGAVEYTVQDSRDKAEKPHTGTGSTPFLALIHYAKSGGGAPHQQRTGADDGP